MEWMEAEVLPNVCKGCEEEDCYNCEYAYLRWKLPQEEELRIRRKMLVKAIERLQKQVMTLDEELKRIQE